MKLSSNRLIKSLTFFRHYFPLCCMLLLLLLLNIHTHNESWKEFTSVSLSTLSSALNRRINYTEKPFFFNL